MTNALTLTQYIHQDAVSQRISELLGSRAPQFVTSLVAAAGGNGLNTCKPDTVVSAALIAAGMDLPINQNLGFAYLIPYKDRKNNVTICQFQMGYKGFIQLAQRSGFYKTINATDVREGELVNIDRLSGEPTFNWLSEEEREKANVVGYIAYFKLLNGFEKSLYMSVSSLTNHAKRYSKNYAKYSTGLWADDFDAMAKKTVIKLLLSKFGPLSTQLQEAIQKDQTIDGEYIDSPDKVEVIDAEIGESEEDRQAN